MDENGLSTFSLFDFQLREIESQTIQHTNICEENYFKGTVDGLYFGGTCTAPSEIIVSYTAIPP